MTDKQAKDISDYLDNAADEVVDLMFEELISGMSVYFAVLLFGEEIEKAFENPANKELEPKAIAQIVKKADIGKEEIFTTLLGALESEDNAIDFAEDCVESIAFNPSYPQPLLEKINELDIDSKEFSIELIITFRDQFIDFFSNDLDVLEWKNDIIDALVANWM
ncbi:hypothetical protein SCLARK_001453 [Spiroplasma clarkii]|uniref:DUF4375 domain-containing protein n=1 Tax=Spiroplasma clarkii TaxID=2139 RepID=A0A1Y0L2H5_9MOLU|nr:hypothetical protein [Spiroplasma clarkii]ARU91970.1 hypothetical protein SCLARK_001453 [Spiroplasma clarkii]ATX71310.1 hypothetical protein SCLAR_v1c10080 [Spiroplasma clarkii]